jgi:hypothetical protein
MSASTIAAGTIVGSSIVVNPSESLTPACVSAPSRKLPESAVRRVRMTDL